MAAGQGATQCDEAKAATVSPQPPNSHSTPKYGSTHATPAAEKVTQMKQAGNTATPNILPIIAADAGLGGDEGGGNVGVWVRRPLPVVAKGAGSMSRIAAITLVVYKRNMLKGFISNGIMEHAFSMAADDQT